MKTTKLNFTLPEDVVECLKTKIQKSKRSAFVAAAVREKLEQYEREELNRLLLEGYSSTAGDRHSVDSGWEAAGLENWPD